MENAILITGCSQRIGLFLTQKFLEKGYYVIAHYRQMTPELETCKNKNAVLVQADFTSIKDLDAMIQKIKVFTRSLRAIIHNASTYERTSGDLAESLLQYRTFFEVHMQAPFYLNERLHSLLLKHSGMRDVIHITDINASRPDPRFDIYSSTKAGLHCLTKSYAKKWAPEIKVNAVAPGPVLFSGKESATEKNAILAKTLLAKEGGAKCVYQAVASILNNEFMTGSCLYVDGGRMLG